MQSQEREAKEEREKPLILKSVYIAVAFRYLLSANYKFLTVCILTDIKKCVFLLHVISFSGPYGAQRNYKA